jgi:uncharacterized protein
MAGSSALHRIRSLPASDLWGYLLFSHGWTWAWWSVNIVGGYEAFGPGLPFTVIGGAGPFLGGIVMSYVTYGRKGVYDLWDRLTELRRIPLRWGVITITFFPLLAVLTGTITVLTTDATFVLDTGEFRALLSEPSAFVIAVLVILIVGPFPEEIGWRGYLLDRCQIRWSALTSGFTVGIVWAAWHAPLFLMPGYFANFDFEPSPVPFAVNLLLISVVYTWVYNNTNRSVLALIGFHFMENFVGQMTSLPQPAEPTGIVLRALIILGIVVWFGARTLRRDGTLPVPPSSPRSL